jgi:hypothetical protein
MLGRRAYSPKLFRRRGGRPRKTKRLKPRTSATPGFEGTRQLCQVVVESPDRRGKYVKVTRNVCGSWSSTVRARVPLDSAQEKAGDHFQCLYEKRTSGKVVAGWRLLMKKREKSKRAASVPIRVLMAGQDLAEVQRRLGSCRFVILELICGLGLTFQEATQRHYGRSASPEDEVRLIEHLLEALEQLALHWGYARQP